MMKRIFLLLATLCVAAGAEAQQMEVRPFFYGFDLAATAATYGHFLPVQGAATGVGMVSTSGSSTTLTADATAQTPFSLVTVGSLITLQTAPNTFATRIVTAKNANNISLTLNSAVNVVSIPWAYQYFVAGTTSTDGWLPALTSDYSAVLLDFTTLSGTGGINVTIQCQAQAPNGTAGIAINPATIYTVNVPAAITTIVPLAEKCANVRVGLAWQTSAAGTDVLGAYLMTWREAN